MKQLVLSIIFVLCWISLSHARMVSIAGEMVNMRSGPGENHRVLWELGRGYPLKVMGHQGDWLKVTDYEGDIGWVQKTQVDQKKAYCVVKNKIVDVRSGPGKKYRVVRQAQHGVVFRTLGKKGDWFKVRHEGENVTGWVLRNMMWGW
jgi:SH3-like domain-containing protein